MPPAAAMSLMTSDKQSHQSSSFNPLSLLSPHSLYQQQQAAAAAQASVHPSHPSQSRDYSDAILSFPNSAMQQSVRSQWPPSTSTQPSSASQTRPSSAHHIANLSLSLPPQQPDASSYQSLFHPSLNSPSNTRPNTQPPQPSTWLNSQMANALRQPSYDNKELRSLASLGQELKSYSLDQLSLPKLGPLNGLQFLNQGLGGMGQMGGQGLMMNNDGMTQGYDYNKPMHQAQQSQQPSAASLASLLQSSLSSASPSLTDFLNQNPHALMNQLAAMKNYPLNLPSLALQMQQQLVNQGQFPLPALNGLSSFGMAGLTQPAIASAINPPSSASSASSSSSSALPSSRAVPGLNGLSLELSHYKCSHSTCGQILKSRFSLKRHMKKHTGEKPHYCPFKGCNRKFSETTALKRHARIHTGEKPYRCGFADCTKTFADATNVKRHEMTHTGEKPYKCLYSGCGRCFSRRSSLRTHMISLHNIRPDSPLIAASLARRSSVPIDMTGGVVGQQVGVGGVVSASVLDGGRGMGKGLKREREESSSSGSSDQSHLSSPSDVQADMANLL